MRGIIAEERMNRAMTPLAWMVLLVACDGPGGKDTGNPNDSGDSGDSAGAGDTQGPEDLGSSKDPGGCGCASAGSPARGALLLVLLALLCRQRRSAVGGA